MGIDRDHPALPGCRYRLTRNLSRRLDSGLESEESTATFGFAGLSSVTPCRPRPITRLGHHAAFHAIHAVRRVSFTNPFASRAVQSRLPAPTQRDVMRCCIGPQVSGAGIPAASNAATVPED